jgi:hypothetical protein
MKVTISETKPSEVVVGAWKLNLCNPSPITSCAVVKPGGRKLGERDLGRKGRNGMKIRGVDKITRTSNKIKTIEPECKRAR